MKEFKEFIMRGNVLDLAVGVIIGGAFGTIVTSLVNDVIMPPIGLLLGSVDFKDLFVVLKEGAAAGPYASMAATKAAGAVTLNYGAFVNTIISFLIIGFSIFVVTKAANRMHAPAPAPAPPATKDCPFCCTEIAIPATRCPHCTSDLKVLVIESFQRPDRLCSENFPVKLNESFSFFNITDSPLMTPAIRHGIPLVIPWRIQLRSATTNVHLV